MTASTPFASLAAELYARGRSSRAYGSVAALARDRVRGDPARAAAWFLLSVVAERFADALDELPVTSADVDALSRRFEDAAATLDAAPAGPDGLLRALNAVAAAHATD